MNINTSKLNQDVHCSLVDQEVVHRLVAERMAEKLGVSLEWPHVTWRASNRTRDTSTGFLQDVYVEIIVDHRNTPQSTHEEWPPLEGGVYQSADDAKAGAQ